MENIIIGVWINHHDSKHFSLLLYMRDYHLEFDKSPTFFRYVDWILTVPLMCVEFYLLTKLAGAKNHYCGN